MNTDDLQNLRNLLTQNESLRLKPYHCSAGKLTIGIGRNLDDVGISKDEAQYLLNNDIKRTISDLVIHLSFFEHLDAVRQIVLIDLCFNMGIGKLLDFNQTLGFIEKHEFEKASEALLDSNYAKQVGKRAIRNAEMLKSGEFAL